jgi:hypothetical protein
MRRYSPEEVALFISSCGDLTDEPESEIIDGLAAWAEHMRGRGVQRRGRLPLRRGRHVMSFIGRQDVDRLGAVIYGRDVRARVLEDGDKLREDFEEVEYVRADIHRGAVDALLAAPMPERESIHKGEEWAERYGEWWHEHVRPHIIGGQ